MRLTCSPRAPVLAQARLRKAEVVSLLLVSSVVEDLVFHRSFLESGLQLKSQGRGSGVPGPRQQLCGGCWPHPPAQHS